MTDPRELLSRATCERCGGSGVGKWGDPDFNCPPCQGTGKNLQWLVNNAERLLEIEAAARELLASWDESAYWGEDARDALSPEHLRAALAIPEAGR